MARIRPDLDIVMDLLDAVLQHQPDSAFVQSIRAQYMERGGLSKKQLEGLYGKASRVPDLPPAKLATLQAIIRKKQSKSRTVPVKQVAEPTLRDPAVGQMIAGILAKFPQHKRILYFKSRDDHDEALTPAELAELTRLAKLLITSPGQ